MASGTSLNTCIRVASAVALLMAVVTSPIRPSGSTRSLSPNYVRRNLALPPTPPTRLPAVSVSSSLVRVKALLRKATRNWSRRPTRSAARLTLLSLPHPDLLGISHLSAAF